MLNDDSIENPPPLPPYYSAAFFNAKKVKDETPLNVAKMTKAQWYRVLLEQNITMVESVDQRMEYVKLRTELSSPSTDWESSWRRAMLKGLGSEALSFLWKLLHNLLPTEVGLTRILPNQSEQCKLCPTQVIADQAKVRHHDPAVSVAKLIKLEFFCEDAAEMPLIWLTAQTLLYMWGVRASGKIVSLMMTRAVLESKISLLRETRYSNEQILMNEYLDM